MYFSPFTARRSSQSAPGMCFSTSSMRSSIVRISLHTRLHAHKRSGDRWKRCTRWLWRRPQGSLGAGLHSRPWCGGPGRPRSHVSRRSLLPERIAHWRFLRCQRRIRHATFAGHVARATSRPFASAVALLPLYPRRCPTSSSASIAPSPPSFASDGRWLTGGGMVGNS